MAHGSATKAKTLFRAIPTGAFDQYLHDIQKLPMISDPAEEKRLARRAQDGDEKAAERLVTANLRFVISYVKKYQGHGLDLSELVAIGNEGLLKAVRKFDPDHGVKFISLRRLVGPPGRAQGARRADSQCPHSAEPEFRADQDVPRREFPGPGDGTRAHRPAKWPRRSTTRSRTSAWPGG